MGREKVERFEAIALRRGREERVIGQSFVVVSESFWVSSSGVR
jgi:hypothetical protein